MLSTGLSVWYMVFCGYRSSSSLSAISCTNLTSKNLKLPNDISLHFTKCLNPVCWPLTLFSVFILQTYIRSSNELCFFFFWLWVPRIFSVLRPSLVHPPSLLFQLFFPVASQHPTNTMHFVEFAPFQTTSFCPYLEIRCSTLVKFCSSSASVMNI